MISNSTFSGNTAEYSGGAIYINQSPAMITECIFQENHAGQYGGAVFCDAADPIIGGTVESGNYFQLNTAGAGADLAADSRSGTPVTATFNTFSGYYPSSYYVTPSEAFDLEGCETGMVPITQDVYVSPLGNDTNDGLTPQSPFLTIRQALRSVFGTPENPITIHLASGDYSPGETGENYPLPIVSYVSLSGTGDTVVLNIQSTGTGLIAYHSHDTNVSHLTIRGANRSGISLQSSSVTVDHCRIRDNASPEFGSGVNCISSNADFLSCIITDNDAGLTGGGIFAESSTVVLEDCLIQANSAPYGGGLSLFLSAISTVNTRFTHNTAELSGGGLYLYDSTLAMQNCLILSNKSLSTFSSYGGGGIYCDYASPLILNSTLYANTAEYGGGIMLGHDSSPVLTNSILWNNLTDEILINGPGSIPDITYCDIRLPEDPWPGTGNFNENPAFTSGYFGDTYLSHQETGQTGDSPCRDTGSDSAASICFETSGGLRCMDELSTRTDGTPDTGVVDLGCHFPAGLCNHDGDLNDDGQITSGDVQMCFEIALGLISPTLETACSADCNGDGFIYSGDAQDIFSALFDGSCTDN